MLTELTQGRLTQILTLDVQPTYKSNTTDESPRSGDSLWSEMTHFIAREIVTNKTIMIHQHGFSRGQASSTYKKIV